MRSFKGYEVGKLIYEGKDVLIYRGYNKEKNKNVILKTLPSERVTLKNIGKLKHEFTSAQKVNCIKGVVKVIELGNWRGRLVLVKEDFKGISLKKLIRNNEIKLEKFLDLAIQIVDIISEIHKKKVIHLDINPNNILINEYGEIKIIDFGSSTIMSKENKRKQNPEQLEGTLAYISPEQTGRIDRKIDYRADYYSLGATFYQLLTGKLPFNSSDKIELIYSHIAKEAKPANEVDEKIPRVISNIIMKLMAKMPEDRYQSIIGLKKDLKRCLNSIEANEKIEYFQIAESDISDRLQIPSKLYGRKEEVDELLSIFEKVCRRSKELVLVKGCAGVGKSSLINDFQNHLVNRTAYFVSGKFEQYQGEIPYSALIIALENFINQLLLESAEELSLWREKILRALGNNGKVITDVIPYLELIIGVQDPVSKLEAAETQNRFNLVFENFMKAIAQYDHPLVMFIDDLQWADSASLNFIKMLMKHKSIEYLMIIGAYRDNEIDTLKPFMDMKNNLIKNEITINNISLEPLDKTYLKSLLNDTFQSLSKDSSSLNELSDFIYNKTQGNPFFLKQFIQSLYDNKYIWFDYNLSKWCWNTEEIKKLDITDNVVELLIKRIKTLGFSTRQELINAACIGNQFDLETLSLINDRFSEAVLEDLQFAVEEGLISPVKNGATDLSDNNIRFRFVHDRVQQSAYSLISHDMKQANHLHIGKLFLKKYSDSEKVEHLFDTVRQLNSGKTMIVDETERIKLAQLNYKAGLAAKSSSAFEPAFIYFQTAIEMLTSDTWQEYYDLSLQLYSEITEMSYLISDYEQMEKYADVVLQNTKSLTDKVQVYIIKIRAYQAKHNLKEALNTGISVLRQMSINISLNPDETDIEKSFNKVEAAMKGKEVEDLLSLPCMRDSKIIAAMQIMLCTIPATYKAAPKLTPILACKMVELSLKYGNSPLSPGAYTFYGLLLCTTKNDVELGHRLGKISIKMVERQDLKQYKVMVLDMEGYSIKHWKEHLSSTLEQFIEGSRVGIETGKFEYSACCLAGHAKNSFYAGRPLKVLGEEIAANIKNMEQIKQCLSVDYKKIFGQLVLNMQGKSIESTKLIGEMCDETRILSLVTGIGDMVGMFFIYISKTILHYYFGEYLIAVETSKKAEENLAGVAGMVDIPIFYFFDSLSRLAIYGDVSEKEKKEILIKVSKNQGRMKNWSKYAPMNFLHKFYLVEAELMRAMGKGDEAIECYDKAISLAKEYEYINDEALANELAAQFWIDKNKYRYAKLHFKEAHFGYKLWGAEAKVKELQNKYIEIFHEKFGQNTNDNHTTITALELVDINTILKASQAISQEIFLDELIKKLIKIIIENVGAQKVVFIMKEADSFIIKGKKEVEEEKINVTDNIDVDDYEKIPKSILNYIRRTNESVVLENSINSTRFSTDKYIIEKSPKSILSFPLIKHGKLKGIIYLENNLMKGAFTRDRLKVLEMLSSQIVISLENASLYDHLESSNEILDTKVKERTAQLKEERDKLQRYLDIAEVLFLVLDKDEKIALINRRGCEVLGYCEDELLEQNWHDNFTKQENREKAWNTFTSIINGNSVDYSDEIVVTKTGEERMLSWHNVGLIDKEGNIEGILSCGIDVTEHKHLREQLEYNKLKLEFFANLSHELKTPLNLSFSALQILNLYRRNNLGLKANEKLEKYTNIIRQNNFRLLRLVNNLIDITKINCNSYDLKLQSCDIVELIKKIAYSVSDYVENKDRILDFNSNAKKKIIPCDPFSIERIILNLLSNAIKFTDEGDRISVNLHDKNDSIVISVKDNGIGIPEDKQKMIFQRFRQIDKSFTRNNEGSGIGLTIVKLLIEMHSGEITVNSKVGEFTEFIVELPVMKLGEENASVNNYDSGLESLIDRIDIEFSDIYGL